jgi:hypothetical protein
MGGHWAMKKEPDLAAGLFIGITGVAASLRSRLFAQTYCTVNVTSSSVKSVLPEEDVSLPVNLITTV